MKFPAFKLVLATNIIALAILFVTWYVNGKDDTWLYVLCAVIVLSSFFYISPRKKDGDK